ncbi:MAG: hypothetical protein AAGI12_06590 [Pseudomonadota bacterium]
MTLNTQAKAYRLSKTARNEMRSQMSILATATLIAIAVVGLLAVVALPLPLA